MAKRINKSQKKEFFVFDGKAFAKAIISYRENRNLTLREAANEAGVSLTALYRMETGVTPDVEKYTRVTEWLNLK